MNSHYCPEWDYMLIDITSPEYECCQCYKEKNMNDSKISELRELLKEPIEWYKKCFEDYRNDPENIPDPHGRTYDESWRKISEIDTGSSQRILQILAEK